MNLFELRGQLGGATFVARAEMHIEQPFERRSVARRALQNIFEQMRGFLRQAVAREQVHIRQRLRDVFLRFFVERFFDDRDAVPAARRLLVFRRQRGRRRRQLS